MKTLIQYLTEKKSINKDNYIDFLKNDGINNDLKEWYTKEYKTDTVGKDLPSITFGEVLATFFNDTEKFEEECCADDSIVRERIFKKLSQICKVDYDDFYNYWLNV